MLTSSGSVFKTSQDVGLVVRKPISGASEKLKFKPAYTAT